MKLKRTNVVEINKNAPLVLFTWKIFPPSGKTTYITWGLEEIIGACDIPIVLPDKKELKPSEVSAKFKSRLDKIIPNFPLTFGVYMMPNIESEELSNLEKIFPMLGNHSYAVRIKISKDHLNSLYPLVHSQLKDVVDKFVLECKKVAPTAQRRLNATKLLKELALWQRVFKDYNFQDVKEILLSSRIFNS